MSETTNGIIRKITRTRNTITPAIAPLLSVLSKSRPVIYRELLKPDRDELDSHLLKVAPIARLCRWKDTDDYTKRLFANFALYEYGSPSAITYNFNEQVTLSLNDPELRMAQINYIRDQFTRKLNAFNEHPVFWFVIEMSPRPHLHGGCVLNHTSPKDFRDSLKSIKGEADNAYSTPLQSSATERYKVDSRYQWVTYTEKFSSIDGFNVSISQQLRGEAKKLYEAFRHNHKACRIKG
jgi:hypothetical protein